MQIHSKIYLCDSDKERVKRLTTILNFLGETILESQSPYSERDCYRCMILSVQPNDEKQMLEFAANHSAQPILLLEPFSGTKPANVLGEISEPFSYPQLSSLLQSCQTYQMSQQEKAFEEQNHLLRKHLAGCSAAIEGVRQLISQVATTDANVLILGESGTGKEVVARDIHRFSSRRDGPFIPINCGAIPADLLESELFGHEKGAFTGAISSRKGRFELAHGGTLFLDEIGDMPLSMQVKLLRVLQEMKFERVGGTKSMTANVRVVAATHRNLEQMIEQESFREDLFYRLNVFPIEVPSLKDRPEDLPFLLQQIVDRLCRQGRTEIRFSSQAIDSLMLHAWSGNVRELFNLVERLMILYPNQEIRVDDLPLKYCHVTSSDQELTSNRVDLLSPTDEQVEKEALSDLFKETALSDEELSTQLLDLPDDGIDLKGKLADLEIQMIRQALEKQGGVVARAASLLGMRRTTLVEKIRKYGIKFDTQESETTPS